LSRALAVVDLLFRVEIQSSEINISHRIEQYIFGIVNARVFHYGAVKQELGGTNAAIRAGLILR
jgi:hypothetical protein